MRSVQFLRPALVVTLLAITHAALADAPNDRERRNTLYEEARVLMDQSRYLEACPKLVEARRLDPSAGGTALLLALCHEGEQKLATALTELREAKAMAEAAKNGPRATMAAEHIEALEAHVSKIVFRGMRPALTVTVDGVAVSDGTSVAVDGGEHVVRAQEAGAPPWEVRAIVATKDDSRVVDLPEPASAPHEAAVPAADARSAAPPPESGTGMRKRTLGYAAVGLGVVATAVGTAFGLGALHTQNVSREECPTSPCSNMDGVSRHQNAQSYAIGADIGIGVGVAAFGAGIALILLDHRTSETTLAPDVTPRSAGLSLTGRF
jgi:hypothetical protein